MNFLPSCILAVLIVPIGEGWIFSYMPGTRKPPALGLLSLYPSSSFVNRRAFLRRGRMARSAGCGRVGTATHRTGSRVCLFPGLVRVGAALRSGDRRWGE